MANRKNVYFTADWHLFHKSSIKFDSRPFVDIIHMHRVLINNYNSVVSKNGLCYFLGDMGDVKHYNEFKEILTQLNGTKVLILGNHDKKHNFMYGLGFDVVLNAAMIEIGGEIVTISHCPLRGVFREDTSNMRGGLGPEKENWHKEHRHINYSVPNFNQYHLHGHTHLRGGKGPIKENKQWDVGLPGNNYFPVSISKIESWISSHKRNKQ